MFSSWYLITKNVRVRVIPKLNPKFVHFLAVLFLCHTLGYDFVLFDIFFVFEELSVCMIMRYFNVIKYSKNMEISCFIFYYFAFFATFSRLSWILWRVVLSSCNWLSITVVDENIEYSAGIHDFIKKKEILDIEWTSIWGKHNIFSRMVKQSLFTLNQVYFWKRKWFNSNFHEMNHVSLIFSKSTHNFLTSGQV